jgi:small GTP-binding protein
MIQKKICLLGGFGVGKTSLVARYVHSIFSDKYMTTVGVKIDKKSVAAGGTDVDLVIWDINGQDDFQKIRMSYLRGASGYLLVADGTRRGTLDTALSIHDSAQTVIPDVPFTLVINKADLAADWQIRDELLDVLVRRGWRVIRTSAKTGADVDDAFVTLAQAMIQP